KSLCLSYITDHLNVFVEVDVKWIRLVFNVGRDPINDLLLFRLVCPENTIPYDKCGSIILVDVFLLRAVVDAVVRRRCENVFNNRMELSNVLSVYPELK